jgi:hypothetical protein
MGRGSWLLVAPAPAPVEFDFDFDFDVDVDIDVDIEEARSEVCLHAHDVLPFSPVDPVVSRVVAR